MPSNSDSEIEDLMNPKDELKKKIVALANTMREWNKKTEETRISIRKQLNDIIDLGMKKRKMEKNELRKLTEEIFLYHGVSESWLRKLLPKELKDTSKTRISYLQRQKIEQEKQRLLQQMPEPRQASSSSSEFGSEFNSREYTPTSNIVIEPRSLHNELPTEEDRVSEIKRRIQDLETRIRRLSESFVAKTYLQTKTQDIPLVAEIDPVKKVIISIQIDKATSI